MREFLKRTFSGIIFAGVLIASVFWSQFSLIGIFFLVTLIALHEYARLVSGTGTARPAVFPLMLTGGLVYLTLSLQATHWIDHSFLLLIPILLALLFISSLFTRGQKSLLNALLGIGGIFYISMPFALLTMLGDPGLTGNNFKPWIIMGFFILMWVNDVFAYLSGSLLGRHPLYKSISPKKSWEGFIGGSAFTLIASYPVFLMSGEFNWMHWGIIALIIVTFGTLGDLAESLLKRQANAKDSGHIMPGHGGILDRFDGVLLSAPAALYYIILFAK